MAKLTVLSYQCEEISEDIGSIVLKEVELSDPGPGEVRVRLKACAVNFPDLLMIQGKYQFNRRYHLRQVRKQPETLRRVVPNVTSKKAIRLSSV